MNRFIDAIELSIQTKNWFSALALTLTLPDICGALETPNAKNGERYKRWFKEWVEPTYTTYLPGIGEYVFLSAESCWALRCSYLHAGNSEIRPNVKSVLDAFHFIIPPPNGAIVHLNQFNNVLQLQIDEFCGEMIGGVIAWQMSIEGNDEISARQKEMLQIHA